MKFLALIAFFIVQSAFACDVQNLRKDVFSYFKHEIPVTSQLGEIQAKSTLKEISVTDSAMHVRGEDFFMTKMVFNILWANGVKEEKEILLASIIDMANCKIETYESGEIFGSSLSTH